MREIFEVIFDIGYLITVIFLGTKMLMYNNGHKQYMLAGIMAIVLGAGDAFHLIPRVLALCTTGLANYTMILGVGKLITSITMTAFYIIMYYLWRIRYTIRQFQGISMLIWILAFIRIILCIMPQNEWLSTTPSIAWGIYRNIPFLIIGIIVTIIFYNFAKEYNDTAFDKLWLTIVLSFAFYIPVVLLSNSIPMIGLLMIPKTCAYIWTVLIAYNAMKGESKHEKIY